MSIKWKYIINVEEDSLINVEKNLNIKFPSDFKEKIYKCNAGKPSKECFDIHGRKECVLDYMVSVNSNDINSITNFTVKMWNSDLSKELVPIALDPFGNIIAYKIIPGGQLLSELVFWNHENKEEIYIAKSFSLFLQMLY